jgi:hypothetical protein
VNSKEENSYDFCPNYIQEFGLWPEKCIGMGGGDIDDPETMT